MKKFLTKERIQYNTPVLVCLIFIVILFFLPTGYQEIYREAEQCVAEVLETDESKIIDTGLVRSGEQSCTLRILNGQFEGEVVEGVNMLNGSLEQDKIFAVGDRAQVVVSHDDGQIIMVTMIDHDRIPMEIVLLALFVIFLVMFAGKTGVRAVLCFILTILTIWKVLVPFFLKGYNPIWIGIAFTLILSVMIIALVYGFDRRCASAVSGTFLGVLVTCLLGMLFTDLFKIHGAVMSSSESLLYAGYQDLHGVHLYRRFRRADRPVGRYHLRGFGGCAEAPGYWLERSHRLRHECRPRGDGHHDHHPAAGLFRRLYRDADGLHGAGHPADQHD